jgi:dipeptide/tripeptide permease
LIIANEGCERFSFYGMRAMLVGYSASLWVNLRGAELPDAEIAAKSLVLNLGWFEFTFLSEQLLFVNPGLVMVLIPAMSLGVYPWLERRGLLVNTLPKMPVGMAIASLAYVAVALI